MTASELILVDSSGWVEYMGGGPKEGEFGRFIDSGSATLLPTIVIYEVYKKLWGTDRKTVVERFVSHALRQLIVPLDERLAMAAAQVSVEHKLHMADAIIYATARSFSAKLITSDQAFRGLPGATQL